MHESLIEKLNTMILESENDDFHKGYNRAIKKIINIVKNNEKSVDVLTEVKNIKNKTEYIHIRDYRQSPLYGNNLVAGGFVGICSALKIILEYFNLSD